MSNDKNSEARILKAMREFGEPISTQEIGDVTGIPLGTVSSVMSYLVRFNQVDVIKGRKPWLYVIPKVVSYADMPGTVEHDIVQENEQLRGQIEELRRMNDELRDELTRRDEQVALTVVPDVVDGGRDERLEDRVAAAWSAVFGVPLDAEDVRLMLSMAKRVG